MTSIHLLALDLQVERDLVRAPVVAGHTAVVPRILCFHRADDEAAVGVDAAAAVYQDVGGRPVGAERKKWVESMGGGREGGDWKVADTQSQTHFPFSHLMVGRGSPTALHGRMMSFIQGVVTVPLKVRILAGAAGRHTGG